MRDGTAGKRPVLRQESRPGKKGKSSHGGNALKALGCQLPNEPHVDNPWLRHFASSLGKKKE